VPPLKGAQPHRAQAAALQKQPCNMHSELYALQMLRSGAQPQAWPVRQAWAGCAEALCTETTSFAATELGLDFLFLGSLVCCCTRSLWVGDHLRSQITNPWRALRFLHISWTACTVRFSAFYSFCQPLYCMLAQSACGRLRYKLPAWSTDGQHTLRHSTVNDLHACSKHAFQLHDAM
jgi:hypothetical protein